MVHCLIHGNCFKNNVPCYQNGCFRTFKYTWSLKRHFQKEHNALLIPNDDANQAYLQENGADDDSESSDGGENEEPHQAEAAELDTGTIVMKSAQFLCQLRSKSSITATTVSLVQQACADLVSDVVDCIRNKVQVLATDLGVDEGNNSLQDLNASLNNLQEPFSEVNTDYKLKQFFKRSEYFVEPKSVDLPGEEYRQITDQETGVVRQIPFTKNFQYVPLRPLLKMVLSRPGVMEAIMQQQQRQNNDGILQDFSDGALFKRYNAYRDKILILLYQDDVELANPLGSRKHKIGLIYMTVKSLPSKFNSAMSQIYLVAAYDMNDSKVYGIDAILRPIIDDLKSLEEDGLNIETRVFSGNVGIAVAQVVGDNLGVHGLLGFVESFSANFPCRRCKMPKEDIRMQCVENQALLRNEDNYREDIATNDVSRTGIRRQSIFNELGVFHVTRNFAPDIMHDLLEGVCMWDMKLVINELVHNGAFTLDTFNGRITSYDYGFADISNKPSCFTDKDIRSPFTAASQTASQMWCLMRHFCLMMGDCVEEGNEYWEVILALLQCMDIIFSPSNTIEETYYLKHLIRDHHEMYAETLGAQLKPKHHFMLHYPKAIREIGPLVQFWAMRFEGKHQYFKQIGHVNCNFRNIPLSLASKHQMQLCYTQNSMKSIQESEEEIGPGNATVLASMENGEVLSDLLNGYPLFDDVFVTSWIKISGTTYRKGMIMVIKGCTDEHDPTFGKIHEVLVLAECEVKLIIEKWFTVGFSRHLHAYEARPCEPRELVSYDIEQLPYYHPLHATKAHIEVIDPDCNWYISPRHAY